MTDKEKIAQIIAKRLCPSRNSHFQLYGDNATCYSRMNFAECTAIADTVDALIAAGIGDVSEYKHRAEVAENKLFDLAMFCTKGNRNFHGKSESEHEEEARKLFNEWLKQSEQELREDRK